MNITAAVVELRLYNPVICLFVCSGHIDSCCKGVCGGGSRGRQCGMRTVQIVSLNGVSAGLSASRKKLIIISLIMSARCPSASHQSRKEEVEES